MKKRIAILTGITAVVIGSFMLFGGKQGEVITSHEEAGDVKQLVQQYSASRMEGVSASITSDQLIVATANAEPVAYSLPKEEFFVSIAPYLNQTHPCAIHSLTGCQGELSNQAFRVFITDEEDNVVMDEEVSTLSNGFIDLWLPRDQKYSITIEQQGRLAKADISTFKDDNTCITTMQLS